MNQRTLNGEFTLTGKGLHTGLEITARFLPAPENHGYKIKRVDLEGQPVIDALAENVVATNRGTVIAKGGCPCLDHRTCHVGSLCRRYRQLSH